MPKALVMGCNGQDGTYLSRLLLEKGYEVAGTSRTGDRGPAGVAFSMSDVCNREDMAGLVAWFRPDEVYCLAAYHHPSESTTGRVDSLVRRSLEVNTLALNDLLHTVVTTVPAAKVFYAASSRVFGMPPEEPQTEATPMNPKCAYGISKAAGVQVCRFYRESMGVHASTGILYNHESPIRSGEFVSRKIVRGAIAIKRGLASELVLADLDATVDWGYAPDFAEAMWRIAGLDIPGDFVVATGRLHSVRDFAAAAFRPLGLDWRDYVKPSGRRDGAGEKKVPLRGDSSSLRQRTGWQPGISFEDMVALMVEAELAGGVAGGTPDPREYRA